MKFSFETIVSVSSEKIWEYYSNTKKWYLWEDNLEDITIQNDNFITGNKGVMKLKNMPPMDFTLTSVIRHKEFIDVTQTPMGNITFGHFLIPTNKGTIVKHEVSLDNEREENINILKGIFKDVPDSVFSLKKVVESYEL